MMNVIWLGVFLDKLNRISGTTNKPPFVFSSSPKQNTIPFY